MTTKYATTRMSSQQVIKPVLRLIKGGSRNRDRPSVM